MTGKFTDRVQSAQASSAVPENGLDVVNVALGTAINELSDLVLPTGVRGTTSLMASFRSDDYSTKPRENADRMVGLFGLVDGVHQATRLHVSQLHMRYKDQVLETLSQVPWHNPPTADLQGVVGHCAQTRAKLTALSNNPDAETLTTALSSLEDAANEALGDAPTRAAKAKFYWALRQVGAGFHHLFSRHEVDKFLCSELEVLRDDLDDSAKRILNHGDARMLGNAKAEFTMLDNKGNPILLANGKAATATIDGTSPDAINIIDFVVGAVGGMGSLNAKYTPAYKDMTTRLIGNASNTLNMLAAAKESLGEALMASEEGLPKENVERALSLGGVNFTPFIWQHIGRVAEKHLPEATMQRFVTDLSKGKTEIAFDRKFTALIDVLGLQPPATESLLPSTRYHYLGMLKAMDEARVRTTRLFGSKESRALEKAIDRATLHLVPQEDEIEAPEKQNMPYFYSASPTQTRPDGEMSARLKDVLDAARVLMASRKEPMPDLKKLSELVHAGLEAPNVEMAPKQARAV